MTTLKSLENTQKIVTHSFKKMTTNIRDKLSRQVIIQKLHQRDAGK